MKKILLSINILIIFVQLVIFIFSYINPEQYPLLNLSAVVLPYLTVLSLLFIIAFTKASKGKMRLFNGIFIVFYLIILKQSYVFNFGQVSGEKANTVNLLSYNTSFFHVKNVFKPGYYLEEQNRTVGEISSYLINEAPEIVCLQEFFNDESSDFYNVISQFKRLGYHHYMKSNTQHDNGLERGIITFSKFPIINKGIVAKSINRYNGAIFTDLRLNDGSILRVVNVHLTSMETKKSGVALLNNLRAFIYSFKQATADRLNQMNQIDSLLESYEGKIIIAGDFNETPHSFLYKSFNDSFLNAHEEQGSGFGFTYPLNFLNLALRIDNIFYSADLEINTFETKSDIGFSDHYPIKAMFTLPPNSD